MEEALVTRAAHYRDRLLRETRPEELCALPRPELRRTVEALVGQMLEEERAILSRVDRDRLVQWIVDETTGYGPLEPLLADESITEIMVNGPREVWVEREGRLEPAPVRFRDREHIRHIIDRIIARVGRRIDESSPMVDARLPDGSRVNAVIPPVALSGPVLTIRKFRPSPFTLDDLVAMGSLHPAMAGLLAAAVRGKLNILISGGTGSGKTTLLAALAGAIPGEERVITIEDMAELRLPRPHVVALEARPPNVEGRGEIPIRQLVRNALRMRPDRIIVGEVRGEEALDMLQAMNTGHEGSLTTIHANSPHDAFVRLEAMVAMAGGRLPVRVIREHLVAALDLVVQTERLTDGSRKVVAVAEVRGGAGRVRTRAIFRFERTGVAADGRMEGRFRGLRPGEPLPRWWARLEVLGVAPDPASLYFGER